MPVLEDHLTPIIDDHSQRLTDPETPQPVFDPVETFPVIADLGETVAVRDPLEELELQPGQVLARSCGPFHVVEDGLEELGVLARVHPPRLDGGLRR